MSSREVEYGGRDDIELQLWPTTILVTAGGGHYGILQPPIIAHGHDREPGTDLLRRPGQPINIIVCLSLCAFDARKPSSDHGVPGPGGGH